MWIDVNGSSKWLSILRGGRQSWSAYNIEEAVLSIAIYRRLLGYGLGPESVAIITTYRAQATLIRMALERLQLAKPPIVHLGFIEDGDEHNAEDMYDLDEEDIENLLDLRISETVDSFQGREKPVIIYSIVKDGYHKALASYCRFNVAISRAKSKLIVLSSMGIRISELTMDL